MPDTAPAPLLVSDLTAGQPIPYGIPIVCCGTEMVVEGDADGNDWACDCGTAVSTLRGAVAEINRPRAAEWEELGNRLTDELHTLRTSTEQLIAARADNTDLHTQAVQARLNAARIVLLLDGLETLAGSLPVQH